MKRVYVAGAYSADNVLAVQANIRRGMQLAYEVLQAGLGPFAPWLDFTYGYFGDISLDRYYAYSIAWLEVADALLVVPEGAEQSRGTQAEIEHAKQLGIPIFWSLDDLLAWNADAGQGHAAIY